MHSINKVKIRSSVKSKMEIKHNYLPKQYKETAKPVINHNYLPQQFADYKEIFKKIEEVVKAGDFTLGKQVDLFEEKFAEIVGTKYAIGVASGTDALFLSLKALGIGNGDEVVTTPYTFFATVGSIVAAGAIPVFADIGEDLNINADIIEEKITEKTKAILPVHWSGMPCDMDRIMSIAGKRNLFVVEDACHAIKAKVREKSPGSFGNTGCFSLHPLKNLNVWGDGGVIVTNSEKIHDRLVLLRNHGLLNRNECVLWGYNSRLDSIQAVVASHLLKKLDCITESRIKNAKYFDEHFSKIPQIKIPKRELSKKHVYHIYVILAERRNELQNYLSKNSIDAKIHYPLPMHLQPASKNLGYREGDFPLCEKVCKSIISLPVHEFVSQEQLDYTIKKIKEFYNGAKH